MQRMFNANKTKGIVGLEIEAGSIAATEVRSNGAVEIAAHAIAPLAPGVFHEGDVVDSAALAEALRELFAEHKLSKNVRLGIANQRVAVRTLHLPVIEDPKQLETAIRFQAQDSIPMPLDQAVLDYEVVSRTVAETGEPQMEVVAVAARREMVTGLVGALSKASLRPTGIDLSAFGMIRALHREASLAGVGAGEYVDAVPAPQLSYEERLAAKAAGSDLPPEPASLYCHLGDVTNLAVAQGSTCLFTRVSTFGIEGIAQRLAERKQLTLEHARQWLTHVGLEAPVEELEGDGEVIAAAREALAEGEGKLADELRLSLDYYAAQERAVAVEGVVVCGPGTRIPGLVERLRRNLGFSFKVARPEALAHLGEETAARLTLSYGLALKE